MATTVSEKLTPCDTCPGGACIKDYNHRRRKMHATRNEKKEAFKVKGIQVFTEVSVVEDGTECEMRPWIEACLEHDPPITLIGLEHVWEVHRHGVTQGQAMSPKQHTYWVCDLCAIVGGQIFDHLTSPLHKQAYIMAHWNEAWVKAMRPSLTEPERQTLAMLKQDECIALNTTPAGRDAAAALISKVAETIAEKRGCGASAVKVVRETVKTETEVERQNCLAKQVTRSDGQGAVKKFDTTNLSEVQKTLLYEGGNFALARTKELCLVEDGASGDGPAPLMAIKTEPVLRAMNGRPLGMAAQMYMRDMHSKQSGPASSEPMRRLSMLQWLHHTGMKVDMHKIRTDEMATLAAEIGEQLQRAVEKFTHASEPIEEPCRNPNPISPSKTSLKSWLSLTLEFLSSEAWLSSQREVLVAKLVMDLIKLHEEEYKSGNVGEEPEQMEIGSGTYDWLNDDISPMPYYHPTQGFKPLPPWKLSVCKAWQRDKCERPRDQCKFAHGGDDIKGVNRWKTGICTSHAKGNCPFESEKCPHAHGKEELREVTGKEEVEKVIEVMESAPIPQLMGVGAPCGWGFGGPPAFRGGFGGPQIPWGMGGGPNRGRGGFRGRPAPYFR